MESLSDTKWDVVISGTGLQQSLLALALSRSGKNVLHIDPNEYYGDSEAALSLKDADEWAERHAAMDGDGLFAAAQVKREGDDGLAASRSYSLALAPQFIHARSELLNQLVSSKAFRQIEFLAVGSFFVLQPGSESTSLELSRIPSTREDVFSNTVIPSRAKRSLMKFLRFVLQYDSEPQAQLWKSNESDPLTEFLEREFKLDSNLQSYVVTLTLSLDGKISVGAGLAAISRHLKSMGVFGAGFAAVYPKWGGLSEVAQVGCRAGAVGGAVYMLGVGLSGVQRTSSGDEDQVEISLTNDVTVKSKILISNAAAASSSSVRISRLIAVVSTPLSSMFEVVIQGAPAPCVAVVALPGGSISGEDGTLSQYPIYATVHSSDTGECPTEQCTIYLTTLTTSNSTYLLDTALRSLLAASSEFEPPKCLWRMQYEQMCGTGSFIVENNIGTFECITPDLSFNDSILEPVQQAWQVITGKDDDEYMKFEDREGINDDDDAF
ncbi:Rab proteins geranylgeranyltransferase component A [Conoideocrella luteorostrata]|uniref:Rab proteins geranylgeranyltransferase n=1 Tax=Conoideocrella luteorostrata TaxID=1105319 RepID=A0AAJ0CCA2_9HYPO|nr:Rab proteins geranylgeranyltransferase component A [Conoideocrella luteorostrata]